MKFRLTSPLPYTLILMSPSSLTTDRSNLLEFLSSTPSRSFCGATSSNELLLFYVICGYFTSSSESSSSRNLSRANFFCSSGFLALDWPFFSSCPGFSYGSPAFGVAGSGGG